MSLSAANYPSLTSCSSLFPLPPPPPPPSPSPPLPPSTLLKFLSSFLFPSIFPSTFSNSSFPFPSSSVVLYFVRPDEKALWKQRGKEPSKTSVFGLLTEKFVEVLISWNRRYDTPPFPPLPPKPLDINRSQLAFPTLSLLM